MCFLQPFVLFLKNDDVKTVKKESQYANSYFLKIKMERLFLFLWILVLRIIRKIIFEGVIETMKSKRFLLIRTFILFFNKKLELNAFNYGK